MTTAFGLIEAQALALSAEGRILLMQRLLDSESTEDASVRAIADQALELSPEARMLLARRLSKSLETIEATRELWSAVAKQRWEELESGKVQEVPGEEALAQMRRFVAR